MADEKKDRLRDEQIGEECLRIERALGEDYEVDTSRAGPKGGRPPSFRVDVTAPDSSARSFRPPPGGSRRELYSYLRGAADFLEAYTEE